MAAELGDRSPISYVFFGVIDFICLLMAAESLNAQQYRRASEWAVAGVASVMLGYHWPKIKAKLRRSKHAAPVRDAESPLEIIFDPTNPARRFWSMESVANDAGQRVAFWEYRVEIKNRSMNTLRNVSVTTERLGAMPERPADQLFDKIKKTSCDIKPQCSELVPVLRWPIPIKQVGMLSGPSALAYGPVKVTSSADDVIPVVRMFSFDYQVEPMLFDYCDGALPTIAAEAVSQASSIPLPVAVGVGRDEWRQLAKDFAGCPWQLRAAWNHCGKPPVDTWKVGGWGHQEKCESLCKLAGATLMQSPRVRAELSEQVRGVSEPLYRWLFFLKERYGLDDFRHGVEVLDDESKAVACAGYINNLSQRSEAACYECAAKET